MSRLLELKVKGWSIMPNILWYNLPGSLEPKAHQPMADKW